MSAWQDQRLSRRKFLLMAGGALAGVAGWRFFSSKYWPPESANGTAVYSDEEADVFFLRQVITADNRTSRRMMWHSTQKQPSPSILYRVCGNEQTETVIADQGYFPEAAGTPYIHTAFLSGLKPGTTYEFRVANGSRNTKWQTFTTDGSGAFKALIFPDSQSSDYSDWEKLAQSAWERNPDAAFFANLGDLVDNGEDASQWRAWFYALHGMIEKIPVVPVLGNHETYNLQWKVRNPEAYLNFFSLPSNGNQELQNQYYAFDYGNVHFSVLNTQLDEMTLSYPELLAKQKDWLVKDLAQSKKKWKAVFMHKDVLTYEIHGRTDREAGISDIGRSFMPIFDEYKVDLVLTAHLHTYRRRAPLYHFQPDKRGPLYIVTGVAGNVRYPDLWVDHPLDAAVAPQPETNNYMTLEAAENSLRLAAFLPSGERFDFVELSK